MLWVPDRTAVTAGITQLQCAYKTGIIAAEKEKEGFAMQLKAVLYHGLEKSNPAYWIRQSVFVNEQGFAPDLEFDEKDRSAFHVLVCLGTVPVAAGRFFMLEDGKTAYFGRIAVLREYRGKQIGVYLLGQLERYAKQNGARCAMLGAQLHAVGFYEKNGYLTFGEVFDDCGKKHIHMKKVL